MLDRLPDFIDPIVFADRQRQLQGEIALNQLNRLSDALSDDKGVLSVDLSFKKEGRLPVISGHLNAQLKLTCQSCLQSLDWPVDIEINLAVVSSLEQADLLAGEYDPLVLEEEKISLTEVLEEELLLALPDFPRHQEPCLKVEQPIEPPPENDTDTQSSNPFAVLAQLKNTGD